MLYVQTEVGRPWRRWGVGLHDGEGICEPKRAGELAQRWAVVVTRQLRDDHAVRILGQPSAQ